MKKIFFLSIFLSVYLFGGVWSSMTKSGIQQAFEKLNSMIQTENKKLEQTYSNEVANLINEINALTQESNILLSQIIELDKELAKIDEELAFYLSQEVNLLDISSDINANKEQK